MTIGTPGKSEGEIEATTIGWPGMSRQRRQARRPDGAGE